MDVDNAIDPTSSNSAAVDVEQSLLQQFSCMGTTDHDELVQQLQRLLGRDINYTTAAFFLDMNNWNLQAAICSYLDVDAPHPLPSMCLVSDPVASETPTVEPRTTFKESWHIRNNGSITWPAGCYAQQGVEGSSLNNPSRVPVPSLCPGGGYQLVVEFTSPATAGVHQVQWRMCAPDGSYFGDEMWVIVEVVEEGMMTLTQQFSHFKALGRELGILPP